MGDERRQLGKIALKRKHVSGQDPDAQATADEVEALRALSEQYGVPGIDLLQIAIVVEHLDVVPRDVAESHRVLPVLVRGDRIFLAMHDPRDKRIVDELEFVTGKKVYAYVAVTSTLERTIGGAYDAKERGDKHYLGPNVPADTLRHLGLAAPAPGFAGSAPATRGTTRPAPQPLDPAPASQRPRAVVMGEAVESVARASQISTSDFGTMDADVSSIQNMPPEIRARASAAADSVASGQGKLVLVVDDEEDIRKLLERLLTQRGHRVITADRGLLALRLVKDHVPNLIVLDAMLPELHGFDIAKRIKGSAKYGHIPIVMVSAVYRGGRIAEDLKDNYGVDAYVEKPFRVADVMDTVQRLLAKDVTPPESAKRDLEQLSEDAAMALDEGVAAYNAGHVDAAIEHLKRGVGIDPLSYRLHHHLALLHGKKGQIFDGIQEMERAVDLNPKHFSSLKNLALLYEKAGFKTKAVQTWQRCAQSAPDDATRANVKERLAKLS